MAKGFFLRHVFEAAIGGGDEAEIDIDRRRAADAHDAPLLQHAQQFGLHLHGHLADFVEKDGAAISEFKFARLAVFRGAGKAPGA